MYTVMASASLGFIKKDLNTTYGSSYWDFAYKSWLLKLIAQKVIEFFENVH